MNESAFLLLFSSNNLSTIHLYLLVNKQIYEISSTILSKDTIAPSDLLLFTSKQS